MKSGQNLSCLSLPQFLRNGILLVLLTLLTACSASTPPPPNKTIYAVSANGTLYAMDGKDGSMRWSYHMSGDNGSPWGRAGGLILENGVIYTSSSVSGGYVYAFQAQTGAILWHTQVHPQGLPATPKMGNGIIYLAVTDTSLNSSHISAFKAVDGSRLWSIQVKGCASSPVLMGNSLYLSASICTGVGQQEGFVYALNAGNGLIRWQHQLNNTVFQQVLLNGVIYSNDGAAIFAFRADDGVNLWQKTIRADSLVGSNNTLYASVNSALYALRASDGKQLWQVSIGNHASYNLTVSGNTLYIVSFFNPDIYALRTQDGTALWNYQSRAFSGGSFPIVDNGIVYYSTLDGTIYELAASDGTLIANYAITDARLFTHSPLTVST